MEALTDFLFLGSKNTENGDCSSEISKRLLFGKNAMKNQTIQIQETVTNIQTMNTGKISR